MLWMQRILSILLLLLSLSLIATGAFAGELRVERVLDGDTVYLSDGSKIRLYGIDAPERRQAYGSKSRDVLATMAGGSVRIEKMDVDRYGRIVAVVWINGVNVNRVMVEAGASWWKPARHGCMTDTAGLIFAMDGKPWRVGRGMADAGCGLILMPWNRGSGRGNFKEVL